MSKKRNNLLRLAAALLAACFTIGFAGCNGDGSSGSGETAETAGSGDSTAEAEQHAKVGFIFHGSVDTNGITSELNAQRLKANTHSDIETVYIDNVSITDFGIAVSVLAEAGCTDIVACSPVYTNALNSACDKFMNINFISMGAKTSSFNVAAYTEHVFQGSYIAGLAAAYNSEAQKIGIVADPDMLYCTPVINAAGIGMSHVYDTGTLTVAYATRDSEIREAVDALDDEGCDVIICYTESSETERYCEELGIDFIGNLDFTATESGYENMLMYFYCKRDSYLLAQYKQINMDEWTSDAYVGTMGNGTVRVSEALPAAKEGTQEIMSALIPKVSGGNAYIFEGELKNNSGEIMIMKDEIMSLDMVYSMNWFVQGVKVLESFRQPNLELEPNSFEIKK